MNEGIYFADVDLPFHVWVREPAGASGYRWVLREAPRRETDGAAEEIRGPAPSTGASGGSS